MQRAASTHESGDGIDATESDDPDDDDEDSASQTSSTFSEQKRRTSFSLEGQTYNFENPTFLVLAAARQLGMAIKRDVKLLWIADEGLTAEDPAGWDKSETPTGEVYYTHQVTGQVLWQHPLDFYFGQARARARRGRRPALQPAPDVPRRERVHEPPHLLFRGAARPRRRLARMLPCEGRPYQRHRRAPHEAGTSCRQSGADCAPLPC